MDPPQAIAALADKFASLGGELRLETALDSLIAENGVIHGVRVARDGRMHDEPARAVVVATGGFQGNPELLSRYVVRDPDNLYLRANAWSTGDGFLAATQVGAAASPGLDTFYGHALTAPPARFSKLEFRDVSQFYGHQSIAVNLLGERFADESDGNAEDALNQRLAQQPQGRGFYIIDEEILDSAPIQGVEIVTRAIIERARAAKAPVIIADTIEDLCRNLVPFGMPGNRLFREINEFNRLIESGQADDLKPARRRNRKSLRRAPFYAVGVKASITFTMGGLQIDERARVLRRAGGTSPSVAMPTTRPFTEADSLSIAIGRDYRQTAIEGLYAAGCDAGNINHFGYMGGLAPALVTGRTAGRSAAGFIKKRR
ncbi:MAG: FAD-binding protein, partial [Betaproteobacteria bacterium]|nr:FAD-binding protein [Betaproteobacteria bacterium]